jgi:hypothetical protein
VRRLVYSKNGEIYFLMEKNAFGNGMDKLKF